MKLVFLLLMCAAVICTGHQARKKNPPLISVPCNDAEAENAADLSLEQLNENLLDGFILGLKRITSVHKQSEKENGTVYYLTLDVFETQCHVLSREDWKDCESKPTHEAVVGECKVVFSYNIPQGNFVLHKYDCTVKRASDRRGCGGCHMSKPLNDTRFQQLAKKSLTKFNKESNFKSHFVLGDITKGTVQVVAGTIQRVEFVIHESDCNKSDFSADLTLCQPSNVKTARTGYCKSEGYAHWSNPSEPTVKVFCKIFEPEEDVNSEEILDHPEHPQAGKKGKKHKHHKRGRKRGRKHGHKHTHKHDHSHDHHHHHHHRHNVSQVGCGIPDLFEKPIGRITFVDAESSPLPDIQGKRKIFLSSKPSFPGRPNTPGGENPPPPSAHGRPAAPPHLCMPFFHPFPDQASTSDQCPGQVKNFPRMVPTTESSPDRTLLNPTEPTPIPK